MAASVYNILSGGTCLQNIDLPRNNDAWLNALYAKIIPDSTTDWFLSTVGMFDSMLNNQIGRGLFIAKEIKDIRSIQLGKSALITGIECLLKKADFDKPEK
nr:hypothetical protein [Desulfospira joergensenii]